jgi:hypothetical protein
MGSCGSADPRKYMLLHIMADRPVNQSEFPAATVLSNIAYCAEGKGFYFIFFHKGILGQNFLNRGKEEFDLLFT